MADYIIELRNTVAKAVITLKQISEAESARFPAPGKWSPREIVGHLIDSASNNHRRFVQAQLKEDLIFPGYDQEAWVRAQIYNQAPWAELIDLWSGLNRHLARVMEIVPDAIRYRKTTRHNFDMIAWQTVPADEESSLDYFMKDYVGHLKHHLKQLFGPRQKIE